MTRSPLWPLFLVVFALSLGALADDTPVDIPDEALRALLAEELGKDADDEITRDDLASLTSLSYTWPVVGERVDIADLTGLEFAVNLTYLYLRGNDIVDLGALAHSGQAREFGPGRQPDCGPVRRSQVCQRCGSCSPAATRLRTSRR